MGLLPQQPWPSARWSGVQLEAIGKDHLFGRSNHLRPSHATIPLALGSMPSSKRSHAIKVTVRSLGEIATTPEEMMHLMTGKEMRKRSNVRSEVVNTTDLGVYTGGTIARRAKMNAQW